MAHKRGGVREGAGRPSSGRSKVQFWISEDETEFLRKMLSEYREGINLFETTTTPNTLSISELGKRNTPPANSPFFITENEQCPKCGSQLKKKISALSKQEYLECTGDCIFTKDV